jgi:hypothetical protein
MTAATPRSGESFASPASSNGRTITNGEFSDEERLFERIFLSLQQSSEMAIKTLPTVNGYFVAAMKTTIQQGNMDQLKAYWQLLNSKCTVALQTAETLRNRLSLIKLKEPTVRHESAFWELCHSFINVRICQTLIQ